MKHGYICRLTLYDPFSGQGQGQGHDNTFRGLGQDWRPLMTPIRGAGGGEGGQGQDDPLRGKWSGLEVSKTHFGHWKLVLIKTFTLIPKMAIFGGWPLTTPLGAGVWTGGEWDPI